MLEEEIMEKILMLISHRQAWIRPLTRTCQVLWAVCSTLCEHPVPFDKTLTQRAYTECGAFYNSQGHSRYL